MPTGAETLINCLEKEGVQVLFGYPGATICPFYDALSRSSIQHILVRQEQNAGHSASGYARMTGHAGVCVSTSGPGALNLLPAIATAYMDSIPLVCITGQVDRHLLGRDAFQEADITGAAQSFTKYSFLVTEASDIPRVVKEAFYIATTGRPGPVLIDLPVDVQKEALPQLPYPETVELITYRPSDKGNGNQIKRVVTAIQNAHRPLLCVGGGVFLSGCRKELRQFVETYSLPVVSTLMGVSVFPLSHPLYFGMLGMHGASAANEALAQADLLVVIGARVGDRAILAPGAVETTTTVIHIDIDPAEIGKNMGAHIPLVGHAKTILHQLSGKLAPLELGPWLSQLEKRRAASPAPSTGPAADRVDPKALLRILNRQLEEDAIIVADVGQNQLWAARSFDLAKGRFLTSGGMGTMGYAIPAAVGAKLARPGRQVVAVCGDGSFQMSSMELATMAAYHIPVKVLLFINGSLGLVREIQQDQYGGNVTGVDLTGSPDFTQLACAYGMSAQLLSSAEDMEEAVENFLSTKGPCLLACLVDPDEPSL